MLSVPHYGPSNASWGPPSQLDLILRVVGTKSQSSIVGEEH